MIEKIRLLNWQNHRDLTITFDQITVLCGPNDGGKSAILRGLLFAALNSWDGEKDQHITWGEDCSKICLWIDGHKIIRSKGTKKGSNYYKLDGQRMLAGKGVPDCIAKIINFRPDNIQQQEDPAFWLSMTSGQAASALNEIFSLTAVDDALDAVGKELRTAKTRQVVSQERLDEARKQRDELAWVIQADKDLKELEELQEKIDGIRQRESQTLGDFEAWGRMRKTLEGAEILSRHAEEALRSGESLAAIEQQIQQVERMIEIQHQLNLDSKSLSLAQEKLQKALAGRCPLCFRTGLRSG